MDELVALWHSQLSSETEVALVKGLKRIVHTHGVKLPIATVFSGTDVIVKILDSFSRYWKTVYAISVEFFFPITCEDNPAAVPLVAIQGGVYGSRCTEYGVNHGDRFS